MVKPRIGIAVVNNVGCNNSTCSFLHEMLDHLTNMVEERCKWTKLSKEEKLLQAKKKLDKLNQMEQKCTQVVFASYLTNFISILFVTNYTFNHVNIFQAKKITIVEGDKDNLNDLLAPHSTATFKALKILNLTKKD